MAARPRRARVASIALALLMLTACGETIDLATTTTAGAPDDTAEAPGGDDTGLDGTVAITTLVDAMVAGFQGLDDDAVTGSRERLDRILEIWAVLDDRLIAERPEVHFGLTQAVDLAEIAIERRRPADATKSQRLALEMQRLVAD